MTAKRISTHRIVTRRKALFCIDPRWRVQWKFLFDAMPESYTGYIPIWDTVPWQEVKMDGKIRDHNYAARAQFFPSYGGYGDYYGIYEPCVGFGYDEAYCHNCMGLVQDFLRMLELDGIDEQEIYARHEYGDATLAVRLRDLFFRQFNPANVGCPILYARPMTFHYCDSGNIGDNGQTAFYCRNEDICDGTTGLREETGGTHAHEFWADVQWFQRSLRGSELGISLDDVPEDAKLVCYIISSTSVPRIKINGTWKVVSPCYFPPYGDPYGMSNRGFKILVADHGLRFGVDDINEIVVEHFSTRGDQCGAQVIFCLEWKERITEVSGMSSKPTKSLSEYIHQGDIIIIADDKAIANGDLWQIVPIMRTRHDARLATLTAKTTDADIVAPAYDLKVDEKDGYDMDAAETSSTLKVYIDNAYLENAEAINHDLLLDKAYPADDQDAKRYLNSVQEALVGHDHATYPLPAVLTDALKVATENFSRAVEDVVDLFEDRRTAIQDRNIALDEYIDVLTPIRRWLWKTLPQGRYDTRLIDYGFTPYGTHAAKPSLPPPKSLKYLARVNRFSWEAVAGAMKYELDVSKNGGEWEEKYKGALTEAKIELEKAVYKVRVRAIQEQSPEVLGDWSDDIEIQIPFAGPLNLRYNDQTHTFSWNNVPGAGVYLLINATTGEELYEGPDISFEKDLTSSGTNSYKVCAGDGTDWGEWSEAIAVTG